MGKRYRRKRSDGEQYVPLGYPMLHSPAWRSLSGPAVKLWLELRTRFHGGNNGRLHLSLDEAARFLQLGKATVARAFKELEAKGFVKLTRRGHWYGRRASEWAVTDRGVDGALPTYAWKQWKPDAKTLASMRKRGASKTKVGAEMDPWDIATGPPQHRASMNGTDSAPVTALGEQVMGSETAR